MRRLYFDVDGTVLRLYTTSAKRALGGGAFERAVRRAGFDEVVCAGNYVAVVRALAAMREDFDSLGDIFTICGGVFQDEEWFRAHTGLVSDPDKRAAEIDLAVDWWYVDDSAEKYFLDAGRDKVYRKHLGSRIFVPEPEGDGEDVLAWIGAIPSA